MGLLGLQQSNFLFYMLWVVFLTWLAWPNVGKCWQQLSGVTPCSDVVLTENQNLLLQPAHGELHLKLFFPFRARFSLSNTFIFSHCCRLLQLRAAHWHRLRAAKPCDSNPFVPLQHDVHLLETRASTTCDGTRYSFSMIEQPLPIQRTSSSPIRGIKFVPTLRFEHQFDAAHKQWFSFTTKLSAVRVSASVVFEISME